MQGIVTAIADRHAGSTLLTQVGTTLTVEDPDEFAEIGQLKLGDEVSPYELVADELILPAALSGAYVEDDPVQVYPLQIERVAFVLEAGSDEELEARVPHSLHDRLASGTRAAEDGELVECELVGDELVVTDVVARGPLIEAGFVDVPHDEVPLTGVTLDTSYTASPDEITIVPEYDALAMVSWAATVFVGEDTDAFVSLLVNGVQTGAERHCGQDGTNVGLRFPVSGVTFVEMAAGEEYVLEIAGKKVGAADAIIGGSKTGGFGYALFAG